MFSRTTFVALLAVASAVSALPSFSVGPEAKAVLMDRRTGKPVTDVEVLKRADEGPGISNEEFLKSCPGGPGSDKLKKADGCIWNDEGPNGATYYEVVDLLPGDHFRDACEPASGGVSDDQSGDLSKEITKSHTFTNSYSISTSTGFELGPISAKINEKVENSSSKTEASTFKMTVSKGRQATLVAKQAFSPRTGSVDLNYGSQQYGHYFWKIGPVKANVIQGKAVREEREADCDKELNVK